MGDDVVEFSPCGIDAARPVLVAGADVPVLAEVSAIEPC
jgi:hypothetical protein